jgi:hypothetical protein
MTYLGRMHHLVGVAVARAGIIMQGEPIVPTRVRSPANEAVHTCLIGYIAPLERCWREQPSW